MDDLQYDDQRCNYEGCRRYFCGEHYEDETERCDVCYSRAWADSVNGGYNFSENEARFCWEHPPVLCGKKYGLKGQDVTSEDEADGEDVELSIEKCCPYCMDVHVCGDDPRDYL
jgi:hypothetical protein